MDVKIPEALHAELGAQLAPFGINKESFAWKKYVELSLFELPPSKVAALAALVEPHRSIRGVGTLARDLASWRSVREGRGGAKARSVEQFVALVREVLRVAPGHRLYRRDNTRGATFCSYVNRLEYFAPIEHGDRRRPAFAEVQLLWREFGELTSNSLTFEAADCVGMTAPEALARQSYFIETPEMRAAYLAEVVRYESLRSRVGLQLTGRGHASTSIDDAGETDRYRARRLVRLDADGAPARLVLDVFRETDKTERQTHTSVDHWFWTRFPAKEPSGRKTPHGHDRDDLEPEDVEDRPEVEVPLHPMLPVFDLRRHLRLRVHVECCEVYEYDRTLASRLVLPDEVRALVEMLVANTGAFRDVVEGKGGGAIVLCAGPPGTGKTLTAEVYAEATARPLYSVQCSQLGTSPDDLEQRLMIAFARAVRWNAIMLLDEADVYIAARGSDLDQNAIVGVFLRVLEYHAATLFLTTNRADLVDDAIASRCIARIDYAPPPRSDLHRLWTMLADVSGIALAPGVIDAAVERYPHLSGRDVKNLLKLARMVAASQGGAITLATIEFVKRFKPTSDLPLAAPAADDRTGATATLRDRA